MEFLTQKINYKFKDKYSYLKLYEVFFFKSNKLVEIKFLYPYNIEITDEDKKELSDFIAETLNISSKINIKFKKSYLDNNLILDELYNYIKTYHSSIFSYLNKDDIKISKNQFFCEIKMNLSEDLFELYNIKDVENKIKNYLEKQFICEFCVQIEKIKKNLDSEDYIERQQQELYKKTTNKERTQRYKISDVDIIFGKDIEPAPEFIKNINSEKSSVILAGNIKNFEKKEYLSKKPKTLGQTKFYYSFILDDTTGQIDVRYFTNKQNEIKMDKLFNGGQVVIVGDVKEFAKKFTLYVNSIAYCKLPEKIEFKSNFGDEFELIKPTPYSIVKQENLLVSEKPLPEEVVNTTYVVFDTETTGLDYERDEIIEIGAVKIKNGVICEQFQTLIKPNQPIPLETTAINNITNEMVATSPNGEVVIRDFYRWAKGSMLVAYNIAFDIKFIQALAKKVDLYFDNPNLDALAIARSKLRMTRYKLSDVVKRLNITLNNAHRALADSVATAEAFLLLMRGEY